MSTTRITLDLGEEDYKALNRWVWSAALAVSPDRPRLSLAQALRAMIRAAAGDEAVTGAVVGQLRRERDKTP
jgi:hypothetical protein